MTELLFFSLAAIFNKLNTKDINMLTSIKTLSFLSLMALIGCQQNVANNADTDIQVQKPTPVEIKAEAPVEKEKVMSLHFKGTIKLIELEGGFYGIITDKGQKILPMNLNPEYMQDGAEIEFSGHYKNVMTIQQWGKPFTVTEVKLIKEGKKKSNPEF